MTKIMSLRAREILDSRGNPTLEVNLTTPGAEGRASVPSGASVGAHEALELRDGDEQRYSGLGVRTAVANINEEIAAALRDREFDQSSFDAFLIALDGTENKSRLGANALIGASMAFARAAAGEQNIPLYRYLGNCTGQSRFSMPLPAFNVLNGGKHADNGIAVQEFMLLPVLPGKTAERVETVARIIAVLKKKLREKGLETGLGDEGGFAPRLNSTEEALDILVSAIAEAGYTVDEIKIGIDTAASGLYRGGSYVLDPKDSPRTLGGAEMLAWYEELSSRYPLVSIEDPFAEDDWEKFAELRKKLAGRVRVVGDDLTVTSAARIEEGARRGAVDTVIIKPNQVGTLTETFAAISAARKAGMELFASHRSGETTDAFIADLAVGASCEYIKTGSLARGERVCKYNRLMEIEEERAS